MSAALARLEDDLQMPQRARHLYLVAVDGHIVSANQNRRLAACMRTGTSALPSGKTVTVYDTASNVTQKITANLAASGPSTGSGQARP